MSIFQGAEEQISMDRVLLIRGVTSISNILLPELIPASRLSWAMFLSRLPISACRCLLCTALAVLLGIPKF